VTPESQYFTEPESLDALEEKSVLGRAGTVAIVHFDIWHRAYRNITSGNRYMMKFLFCRTREPDHILRRSAPPEFESLPTVCDDLWRWYSGQDTGPQMDASSQELWSGSEPEHIEASYRLGRSGQVEALMEHLFEEAAAKRERNWDPRHTNLAQFDSSYGLVAAGSKAVPAIKKAVESQDEAVRAAAVDILGDIGQMAGAAVPDLIDALEDDSEWVRRNATEALGNLAAEDASMALGGRLDDESDRVRHNAALSLIKVGKPAEKVLPELRTARDDGNRYVREISRLACDRLMR
jgi:hypothetical protein